MELFPSEPLPQPILTNTQQLSPKGVIEHSPSGRIAADCHTAHRRKARRSGMRSGEGQKVVRHKDSKAGKEGKSKLGHGWRREAATSESKTTVN